LSPTLSPPAAAPVTPTSAPAVDPAGGPTDTNSVSSGAPPEAEFASALEAAAQGPPGRETKPPTRTAVAEGDQAGSDSSSQKQSSDPAAPTADDAAAVLAAAMAGQLTVATTPAATQPAPAVNPKQAANPTPAGSAAPAAPAALPGAAAQPGGTPAAGPTPPPAGATPPPTGATPPPTGAAPPPTATPAQQPQPDGTASTADPATSTAPVAAAPGDPAVPAPAPAESQTASLAPVAPAVVADPATTTVAPGPASGTTAPPPPQPAGSDVEVDPAAQAGAPSPSPAPTASAPNDRGASASAGTPPPAAGTPATPAQAIPDRIVSTASTGTVPTPVHHTVAANNGPTTTAAAVTSAPPKSVTQPDTGSDARRPRDEAGAAEQPVRLAPAVHQTSTNATPQEVEASSSAPVVQTDAKTFGQPEQQMQVPVRLADLAEAARTAIKVTAQNGGATARITLHPQELGAVEIHLRYQADGVTATIRADNPQAAQTLQQAAPDLRRALEAQGLTLLNLDVRDRNGQAADGDAPRRRQNSSNGQQEDGAPDGDEIAAVGIGSVRTPAAGSQVDVLA